MTAAELEQMLRTGAFDRSSLRRPPNPVSQARIRGRLHGLRRDRAVISHHYDLPSEFYRLVLDSRMTYSSGYFTSCPPNNPQAVENVLDEAQYAKLDMVCRKVGLGEPGATLLDVGCGWGALSIHAATHFGARVVGVTLSAEQKAFADKRIADLGLGDRVRIELRDYREIDGVHDAVASLEMGEHVGERQYGRYARTLRDSVVPGGRVLVQQMSREGRHPGGGPFIESFIAPDMTMRPTADTVGLLTAAGLELVEMQPMGPHYAHTVDGWIANFERNRDRIVALVGLEVTRVWQLYLAGGRTAFAQGRMGVDQILMTRPEEAS
ncbi:class I SAM-dependent methyltransferase [Rhodococcus sp. HNM0569]|nr:class I SAM-dependent methyltransferase [Rhodococcus sp. HNM0569]